MDYIIIGGSEEFINEITKNWELIKPYLEDLEKDLGDKKEICIMENEYLKIDACLSTDNKSIIIYCDHPNLENIKPLINLIRGQWSIRREYKFFIGSIYLKSFQQIIRLAQVNKIKIFNTKKATIEFVERFLDTLIISLEKTLSLEKLSEEERDHLKNVRDIVDPFKESIKNLSKIDLYICIMDNLWRRTLGWRPPNASHIGVDVDDLEKMFDTILNTSKNQDYSLVETSSFAITKFILKMFGINISNKHYREDKKEDKIIYL